LNVIIYLEKNELLDFISIQAMSDEDRMEAIENELKRLKDSSSLSTVEASLGQVRALALRSSTSNSVLIAALENLSDCAAVNGHPDADTYKMVLKACRDSEDIGPLHGLINKLIGSDIAKKITTSS